LLTDGRPFDFHSPGLPLLWRGAQGNNGMKKKVAADIKRSAAKPNKSNPIRNRTTMSGKKPTVPPQKPTPKPDPVFTQAVQNYEAAIKAMQEHKFDKAKPLLEKIIAGGARELMDRARVHLNLCNQQLAAGSTSFKTQEEHFDYSVSLINSGQYDQARAHIEKILKQNPKSDFAYYGMAIVDCLTGQVESSLKNLSEAIRLNPQNRFQARNDSDFQNMADDPRFTELLYPEPTDSQTSERKR
jgi:tetratricopeptide (TPR) repeat protein